MYRPTLSWVLILGHVKVNEANGHTSVPGKQSAWDSRSHMCGRTSVLGQGSVGPILDFPQ